MANLRVVPWEHPDDLPYLARLFFRSGRVSDSHDDLRRACDLVTSWQVRGGVPHAIDATSGLVEARLLDTAQPGPNAFIRTVAYASTISDLVTGYLDNMQTGKAKRSMYDLAADCEMPRAFVEARHSMTHVGNQTISLREHRRINEEALDWIYRVYWHDVLQEDDPPSTNIDNEAEIQSKLIPILQAYNAKKEAELSRQVWDFDQGRPGAKQATSPEKLAADALLKHGRTPSHLSLIANAMLQKDALLQIVTKVCTPDDRACRLWDPLLLELAMAAPCFTVFFVKRATVMLCEQKDEPGDMTAMAWLVHLFTSDRWGRLRYMSDRATLFDSMIDRCENSPGILTSLLVSLLSNPSEDAQ